MWYNLTFLFINAAQVITLCRSVSLYHFIHGMPFPAFIKPSRSLKHVHNFIQHRYIKHMYHDFHIISLFFRASNKNNSYLRRSLWTACRPEYELWWTLSLPERHLAQLCWDAQIQMEAWHTICHWYCHYRLQSSFPEMCFRMHTSIYQISTISRTVRYPYAGRIHKPPRGVSHE